MSVSTAVCVCGDGGCKYEWKHRRLRCVCWGCNSALGWKRLCDENQMRERENGRRGEGDRDRQSMETGDGAR